MREREKLSGSTGAGRGTVGRCGWCWPDSGTCPTLGLLHRNSSVQKQKREGHGVVLEYQSLSGWKASPIGKVSGLYALVLYTEARNSQAM